MPLQQSPSKAAFKANLKTELATKPLDQALAIAYSVRRKNRAPGGTVGGGGGWGAPTTRATGGAVHIGPIHSAVGGRTDHLPMDVPSGAYVIPADIVSGLGQGNTGNGLKILERMFPPENAESRSGRNVPIVAAGGEFVISPEIVAKIGGGEEDRGHKILDRFVLQQRRKLIKTLKDLPGPAK